jgi:hypothetical protein
LSVYFKKIAKDKSKVFKIASELKAEYAAASAGVESSSSYENSS